MTQKQLGSLLITLSALMYGSYGIWSKLMAGNFGEFNQAWIRALILLVLLIPTGIFLKSFKKIRLRDVGWFLLISLVGGANQAPYFYAFHHLNVGTATLLFYVALTLGAYLFGSLGFKEKMSFTKLLSLAIGLLGLFVLYRFNLKPSQYLAGLAGIIAGLMGSVFVVFSKKLSGAYSELQILTLDLVAVFLINLPLSLVFAETMPALSNTGSWLAQLGYAGSFLIANLAVIAGMKHLEPSVGGIIGLSEVVFATLLGVLLFSEPITPSVLIGGLLIIFSAGLNDGVKLLQKFAKPVTK
jgi:drug/metabolite transporter (DMT)-like permease